MSEITISFWFPPFWSLIDKNINLSQTFWMSCIIWNIVRMLFSFCFSFSVMKSKTPKQQDGFLLNKTEGGDLIIMGQIWVIFTLFFFFSLLVELRWSVFQTIFWGIFGSSNVDYWYVFQICKTLDISKSSSQKPKHEGDFSCHDSEIKWSDQW